LKKSILSNVEEPLNQCFLETCDP